jgi:hypothetical protein
VHVARPCVFSAGYGGESAFRRRPGEREGGRFRDDRGSNSPMAMAHKVARAAGGAVDGQLLSISSS